MKVKFNVQQNGVNTLKEKLELHSNSDLKKVYMVIGNMKDTGFDILEEFLIDLKARKYFVVGIDKKNTTRRMLEELCRRTKNVYVYNNNYENELDASVYVFEYAKMATVYVTSGSLSMSSFSTDTACYTELVFDLENAQDKAEYKEYVDNILKLSKVESFSGIDKAGVAKLVEDKEIFSTKQYTHNVLSISELLEKSAASTQEKVEDLEEAPSSIPKIDLDAIDFSMDIDLGEEYSASMSTENNIDFEELKEKEGSREFEEESEPSIEPQEEELVVSDDVIDMESMLFERADIKLKKVKDKSEKKAEVAKSKKVDLEKVSNLFLELPAKSTKDTGELKVPNYVKDLIEVFFEGLNKEKLSENQYGSLQRKQDIEVEIIDVNSDTKYKDNTASVIEVQGKTYVSFNSEKLKDIYYEEKDIARIIKLSNAVYHIEIIPKTTEEYNVWKKLCTTSMRGTDRCYGVM